MNHSLVFSAHGTPRSQPRPRFIRGRVVSTASRKAQLWRLAVQSAVTAAIRDSQRSKPLFTGAVRVTCVFFSLAPSRSDADNLAKLVMDVMENAGVFKNDAQVVELHASKALASKAGVSVMVEDVSEERRPEPVNRGSGSAPAWLRG